MDTNFLMLLNIWWFYSWTKKYFFDLSHLLHDRSKYICVQLYLYIYVFSKQKFDVCKDIRSTVGVTNWIQYIMFSNVCAQHNSDKIQVSNVDFQRPIKTPTNSSDNEQVRLETIVSARGLRYTNTYINICIYPIKVTQSCYVT